MEQQINKMTKFERWQVTLTCFQAFILTLTLVCAVYIGFRQNQINEKLLNLNYIPSLEVAYTSHNKRILIYNKGNSNIWLWGTKYLNTKPKFRNEPVLITPGGSIHILAEKFKDLIKELIGNDGEKLIPFELFIESSNNVKYIVKNRLLCIVKNNEVSIHSQTLSIIQQDWSK